MNDMTTINQADLSEAVRNTALLADVTISMWGAERTDNKAMAEVKTNAGAVGNVGKVVKNLLAGADGALKDTRAAFQAVRTAHYGLTLPWIGDPHAERQRGPRLLPTMLWDKYTSTIARGRTEAYRVRDLFVDEYPSLIVKAKANLGTLADADYPDQEQVRAQFRITIDWEPIPSGAAFKGLPEAMLEKLGAALARKQGRMIEGATTAMWEEVRERVSHITERLVDPTNKFKATTIEAVRDLITLLPGWNVTADPRVTEIASDINRMLSGVDAKALRDNATARQDVAEQAAGVANKLAQWGL